MAFGAGLAKNVRVNEAIGFLLDDLEQAVPVLVDSWIQAVRVYYEIALLGLFDAGFHRRVARTRDDAARSVYRDVVLIPLRALVPAEGEGGLRVGHEVGVPVACDDPLFGEDLRNVGFCEPPTSTPAISSMPRDFEKRSEL